MRVSNKYCTYFCNPSCAFFSSSARPGLVLGAVIGACMAKLQFFLSTGQRHSYLLSLIPTFSACPPLSRSLQSIDFHGCSSWEMEFV